VTKRSVDFSDPLPNNILGQELNTYPQEILDYNPVETSDASLEDITRKIRNHNPRDNLNDNPASSDVQKNPDNQARFSRQQFVNIPI
jgi:hypothetical protein